MVGRSRTNRIQSGTCVDYFGGVVNLSRRAATLHFELSSATEVHALAMPYGNDKARDTPACMCGKFTAVGVPGPELH